MVACASLALSWMELAMAVVVGQNHIKKTPTSSLGGTTVAAAAAATTSTYGAVGSLCHGLGRQTRGRYNHYSLWGTHCGRLSNTAFIAATTRRFSQRPTTTTTSTTTTSSSSSSSSRHESGQPQPQKRRRGQLQSQQQQQQQSIGTNNERGRGRGRYGPSGKKKRNGVETTTTTRGKTTSQRELEEIQPPPLTFSSNGGTTTLRPWYFTCRHGFEDTLIKEIRHLVVKENGGRVDPSLVTTPALGLVRLEAMPCFKTAETDSSANFPFYLDPVYALQVLPQCVVVSAPSIKGLAQIIHEALLLDNDNDTNNNNTNVRRQQLLAAPRSSLAIHGLVPGMFKGQTKPLLERRVQTVVQELTKLLRQGYPAARKQRKGQEQEESSLSSLTKDVGGNRSESESSQPFSVVSASLDERWLLQVLLMTPDVAVASLAQCSRSDDASFGYWPNWDFPAGLAKVDIRDETMPSSAYRKLMEGLECLGICPCRQSQVYDLGASPGGWTWILRHLLDCSVVAIDKSPLDTRLMQDSRIEFIKGDAFTFEPKARHGEVWMVSDVIAFPDRILELLSRWCGNQWADYMIVTMKFHGSQPDLEALHKAIELAQSQGYHCRAKHFFNNKNEVTMMLRRQNVASEPRRLQGGILGTPMYPGMQPRDR